MAKKSYKFNPQTLSYEVIPTPVRLRIYRLLRNIFIGFMLASIATVLFSYFFHTPKMYAINRSYSELRLKYAILQDKIRNTETKMQDIRHRDTYVYRKLFGIDSMYIDGIYTPYPSQKYGSLTNDSYSNMLLRSWNDLDALARVMYLESKSLDELQYLAKDKEKMALYIPAIWPLDRKNLPNPDRPNMDMFGMRNHPVHKRYKMHYGLDIGAPRGTSVYATGNATVVETVNFSSGYGRYIMLDHGFGYKTRYAHLNKISVVKGQTVKRGDIIGEVGNTGVGTGPHLHYEVILMGTHVDPINYFRRDMSSAEFELVLENIQQTVFEEF